MRDFYRLDAPADRIAAALRAHAGGDVWTGGAVTTSSYAPVVVRDPDGQRRMVPRQWGVPSPPRGAHVITTVRNTASPFWIGTLRHTQFRCLVPATAFPLGRNGDDRWCAVAETPVFAFAGIWRDSEVPSFAVLTTDAPPLPAGGTATAAAMPVILRPENYHLWLSGDWKAAQRLVAPCPPQLLRISH